MGTAVETVERFEESAQEHHKSKQQGYVYKDHQKPLNMSKE